ncbi:uncharacterized protein LOC109877123 isoform X3 [Oncorhynchus kisutch]|nr:uncharacterized protein LOC109877123 isoform X3 [Oncorhynchus kisutch]
MQRRSVPEKEEEQQERAGAAAAATPFSCNGVGPTQGSRNARTVLVGEPEVPHRHAPFFRIKKSARTVQLRRLVTSTVRTNPALLSPSALSPNLQSMGPDCDSGAQFALQGPEMASVKLEDCSQTLELNVNIKDEEEEEKIGTSVSYVLADYGMRSVTSTVRTNAGLLSPSTLTPNLQSQGPDCDSGAQFALQESEMTSVKLKDCSQTLELNVNIKDEEEEEKIGTSVSHGRLELSLGTSVKLEDCSQTLELNGDIKDEEEEEKIGEPVSHGDHVETFSTSREQQQQEGHRAKRSHHCPH